MKLFSLGIALFSLFCYSCMDDRLEPVPGEERQAIPFSVNDAREFFENNATDLSPLSFNGTSLTRSEGRANVELNPEWDNAMMSGHKGVTLIEIPLYSTSTVLVQEGIFKNKRLVGTRTTISGRRLIVAKRANGEVDMFVATIVPEARSAKDDLSKMLEDFRYLGGGSFSGKVFCSTLEGKFVKAFGYTDGKLNGTLNTRIRQASGESHPEDEEYSRLIFNETSSARASMFSGNESGGGGGIDYGKCPHGYTKGFCPHGCRAEVEEVEIITCRYCGTRNGCVCSRCFYCGNKEPECSCTRCTICRKKMQDCKCYEYPDPDKPINPPGGGGGGETEETIKSDIELMDENNFVGYDVSKNCMAGCKAIMDNYNVGYGGPNHVYQLLVENDGELVHYGSDHVTNYTNAINCIDRHLDANKPIIVGVNHTPRQNINEGATDHWIVITGRGYDKSQAMYYYTYMDTGYSTARASDACNTTNNRLYYDPTKQTFRDNEDRRGRQLDVTQVRPNDGQNLKETITQPARPTTNN